jgi:hypothetical protein
VRANRIYPVVALVLLALAGCTFVEPTGDEPESEPYSIREGAVLAELGEVPESEPMTPERAADFIARFQDYRWTIVTRSYPDAVRPAVTVVDTTGADVASCMSDGVLSEQSALSDYVCLAQNPPVPRAMLSDDQAGYLYDYWTRFLVPCYEANDHPIDESPPARNDFVARWPFQEWSPRPSTAGGEDVIAAYAELEQFCPGAPEEFN